MTRIDDELRRSLHELAGEGHPVNLGRAALAGARRRRRRHLGVAAVAVAAAAAIALPAMLADPEARDFARPAEPPPAGGGVVTVYQPRAANQQPMVLNPATGEYHPAGDMLGLDPGDHFGEVAVSPDLQRVVGLRSGVHLRIGSTTTDTEPLVVRLPASGHDPVWSPDGQRIMLAAARSTSTLLSAVIVVDADTGEATEVEFELPPFQSGWRRGVAWLDADHLVVPTTDLLHGFYPTPDDVGRPMSAVVITGLSVVHIDGAIVQQVPIHQPDLTTGSDGVPIDDRPHVGLMWAPHPEIYDGRMLLSRQPEPGSLDLAVLDLTSGELAGAPVSVTLPPVLLPADVRTDGGGWTHPDTAIHLRHPGPLDRPRTAVSGDGDFYRTPLPAAWLPDGTVLLDTGRWEWDTGFVAPREHHRVDLSTGQLYPAEPPTDHRGMQVGDGTGLSPEAARRALTL